MINDSCDERADPYNGGMDQCRGELYFYNRLTYYRCDTDGKTIQLDGQTPDIDCRNCNKQVYAQFIGKPKFKVTKLVEIQVRPNVWVKHSL